MKKLTTDEKIVLILVAFYMIGATLVNTFANIFILKYTNSFITISIYSLFRYFIYSIAAYVAAIIATHYKLKYSLILGLILITSAIFLLLFTKDIIANYTIIIYIIGLIWGFGEGMFWMSINTLHQIVSTSKTRAKYLGLNGALVNIATIIAPLISSFFFNIFSNTDIVYYLIFLVAILIFISISLLALKLSCANKQNPFTLKGSINDFRHDSQWRFILINQLFWGIRDAATVSITGLLIYEATKDGAIYSNWLVIFALLACLSNYFIGYFITKKNQYSILIIGSIMLFGSGVSLILVKNVYGAFIHGSLQAIFLAWATIPFSIIAMNIIQNYMPYENIIRRTLIREIFIALGRGIGLIIVILISIIFGINFGLNFGILILYSFCLAFAFSFYQFRKRMINS